MPAPVQTRATAIGFLAVLLWATLALLTVGTAPVPPFQLSAICFAIGGGLGLVWGAANGELLVRPPLGALLLGVVGIFGYHFFYFTALRHAPPAEAGLIAYLWPLLIVLFSGFLPGHALRAGHLIGAGIAFAGAAVLMSGGGLSGGGSWIGYASAGICALTWSGYSVLNRRYSGVPTVVVAQICVIAAALSLLCHLSFETTAWPAAPIGWVSLALLGAGPVGLAFFFWDFGVKHGNIRILGVAAYSAPLLSTLLLVASRIAPPTLSILLAAVLIAGGALIASCAERSAQS